LGLENENRQIPPEKYFSTAEFRVIACKYTQRPHNVGDQLDARTNQLGVPGLDAYAARH
jgi:hypothetical protein